MGAKSSLHLWSGASQAGGLPGEGRERRKSFYTSGCCLHGASLGSVERAAPKNWPVRWQSRYYGNVNLIRKTERGRDVGNPRSRRKPANTSGLSLPVQKAISLYRMMPSWETAHSFVFWRPYFSSSTWCDSHFLLWQYQCSRMYSLRLPRVCAVLTFKCHLQVCWGGVLLLHKFDEKLVCPLIKDSWRKGYQCFPLLPPLNWLCRKEKNKKWYVWRFL